MRVDVFDLLSEPKYDVSTSHGAYCWAVFELELADAAGRAADGRAWGVEGDGGGVSFGRLKEALVDRARRGDEEASRALLDAADVRVPEVVVSLGEAVDVVDASGVRGVALSAEDDELRSRAEALFAWVDEYKRSPFPDTFSLISALLDVSYDVVCTLPPPEDLAVPEDTLTIEDLRALTLEEVENLTPEQLRDIDIETVTNDGLLLREFPLDLQFAWGEKSSMQSAEYFRARCCFSLTTEELAEHLTVSDDLGYSGGVSLLEVLEDLSRNENDPSTPVGAFCWAYVETFRSFSLYRHGYFNKTMVDLFRGELLARAEMGDAAAAGAVRGLPAEMPSGEYLFADALEAVDDPRVRETAFGAEGPVLLEAVGVFYDLVDEARQAEAPSSHAFMAEFLPYMSPSSFQQPGSDEQPLDPGGQARESLLEECKHPGEDW